MLFKLLLFNRMSDLFWSILIPFDLCSGVVYSPEILASNPSCERAPVSAHLTVTDSASFFKDILIYIEKKSCQNHQFELLGYKLRQM